MFKIDKYINGMNGNEYQHNARDVFDRFRIYHVFLTKLYLKPIKYMGRYSFIPLI